MDRNANRQEFLGKPHRHNEDEKGAISFRPIPPSAPHVALSGRSPLAAQSILPILPPLRLQPNRVGVTFAFASAALTGSRSSNDRRQAAADQEHGRRFGHRRRSKGRFLVGEYVVRRKAQESQRRLHARVVAWRAAEDWEPQAAEVRDRTDGCELVTGKREAAESAESRDSVQGRRAVRPSEDDEKNRRNLRVAKNHERDAQNLGGHGSRRCPDAVDAHREFVEGIGKRAISEGDDAGGVSRAGQFHERVREGRAADLAGRGPR
jgi:hypothetical protein